MISKVKPTFNQIVIFLLKEVVISDIKKKKQQKVTILIPLALLNFELFHSSEIFFGTFLVKLTFGYIYLAFHGSDICR